MHASVVLQMLVFVPALEFPEFKLCESTGGRKRLQGIRSDVMWTFSVAADFCGSGCQVGRSWGGQAPFDANAPGGDS